MYENKPLITAIAELSENELYTYYLQNEWDDICSFTEFKEFQKFITKSVKEVTEDGIQTTDKTIR